MTIAETIAEWAQQLALSAWNYRVDKDPDSLELWKLPNFWVELPGETRIILYIGHRELYVQHWIGIEQDQDTHIHPAFRKRWLARVPNKTETAKLALPLISLYIAGFEDS